MRPTQQKRPHTGSPGDTHFQLPQRSTSGLEPRFAEAAHLDKALEIDGYPGRQDLKISLLRLALKEGARVSLGTDAHHPWQLAFMDFALAAAVLAGFKEDRIVNFMSLQELRRWLSQVSTLPQASR